MIKYRSTDSKLYQKLFKDFKGQTQTGSLVKIHSVGFFEGRLAYIQTQTEKGFEDFYNGRDHDCLATAISDSDKIIYFKEVYPNVQVAIS